MSTVSVVVTSRVLTTHTVIPNGSAFMIRLLAFGTTIIGSAGRVPGAIAAMPGTADTATVTAATATRTTVTTTMTTAILGIGGGHDGHSGRQQRRRSKHHYARHDGNEVFTFETHDGIHKG
ncbi:hypothetical protein KBJ94_25010 [Pseudomonas sp. ITA]|nr:hypothetical protein [Pseudomonas sp. ITA]